GVWGAQQWMDSINGELRTFYQMGGREAISLAKASFESWINGYDDSGMPNRRISFYTKGYLVTMLLDWTIRMASEETANLDLVIRDMYQQIAKAGRGYTRADYQGLAEQYAGISLHDFFEKYIEGLEELTPALAEMGAYYGLQLTAVPAPTQSETWWGLVLEATTKYPVRVERVWPDSPAANAGLSPGDEIVSLNGYQFNSSPEALIQYLDTSQPVQVHYFHQGRLRETTLQRPSRPVASIPQFVVSYQQSPVQRERLHKWRAVGLAQSAMPNLQHGS
ncbi:MAG: PDZ domain-containing protein, partial [Bacteroidota bacterium]